MMYCGKRPAALQNWTTPSTPPGCSSSLKYLNDLERANEPEGRTGGQEVSAGIIDAKHRWSVWAAPKKKDGMFDHDKALTGDDLIEYVDDKLFPYLKGFPHPRRGRQHHRIQDRGEIFSEIENKFRSGYSLRDVLQLIDQPELPIAGTEARAVAYLRNQAS